MSRGGSLSDVSNTLYLKTKDNNTMAQFFFMDRFKGQVATSADYIKLEKIIAVSRNRKPTIICY
jgi:hypothetical protein